MAADGRRLAPQLCCPGAGPAYSALHGRVARGCNPGIPKGRACGVRVQALYPFLTVREHVLALARIRGVAEPVGPVVDSLLESLQLKGEGPARPPPQEERARTHLSAARSPPLSLPYGASTD